VRRSARRSTLTKHSLKLIKTKNQSPRAGGCARRNALGERGARGRAARGPRGTPPGAGTAAREGARGRARGAAGGRARRGEERGACREGKGRKRKREREKGGEGSSPRGPKFRRSSSPKPRAPQGEREVGEEEVVAREN
jgi:hypothetical protein